MFQQGSTESHTLTLFDLISYLSLGHDLCNNSPENKPVKVKFIKSRSQVGFLDKPAELVKN